MSRFQPTVPPPQNCMALIFNRVINKNINSINVIVYGWNVAHYSDGNPVIISFAFYFLLFIVMHLDLRAAIFFLFFFFCSC